MDRFQLYLAYTLLGVYVASCLAPWPGMPAVRQMQLGYALGCAGWLMLIHRVWRRPRSALRMTELLIVALALRLFLLAAPVSDDVHRYVWEGRVRLAGFNPYLLAPDDEALSNLRDANWPLINHPDHPAIYPPLAESVCAAVAGIFPSTAAFKIVFLMADLLTVAALAGWLRLARFDPRRVVVYALCPAALSAFAREAHIDALLVLSLAVFLYWCEALRLAWEHRRPTLAAALLSGLALGAAVGVKWVPLLLVPWWLTSLAPASGRRRWKPRMRTLGAGLAGLAIPIVIPALLYADAGRAMITPLLNFSSEFHLLDSARRFLSFALDPRGAAVVCAAVMAVIVLCIAMLRPRGHRALLWTLGPLILLLPTVHPWYVTWLLVPLCATLSAPWIVLAITMVFAFEGDHMRETAGRWMMPAWVVYAVFVPVYASLGGGALRSLFHRIRGSRR